MKRHVALLALGLGALFLPPSARASSHAEAPGVANDPAMDGTDVWAWQDSATTITIVTAWNGFGHAAGSATYRRWAPKDEGVYEIHVDTTGDGVEDVTYQVQFTDHDNGTSTAMRVTSPPSYDRLTKPDDPTQKSFQTYSVSRIVGPRRNASMISLLGTNLPVAPPSTGPQLTWGRLGGKSLIQTLIGLASSMMPGNVAAPAAGADYESKLAAPAVQMFASGERVFVGPRADAFFADLGAFTDGSTRSRTRDGAYTLPPGASGPDVGQYGGGHNLFSSKNVEVIAIQIPIATLGTSFTMNIAAGKYVGVWSSSSRREVRVLNAGGSQGSTGRRGPSEVGVGKLVQVSRVGNPFVNQLLIPYDQKDAWNADEPVNDAAHWLIYLTNPEPALLLNAFSGVAIPPTPRADLSGLFAPDTLKVRVDLGTPLGAGDLAFFGNTAVPHAGAAFSLLLGRTPADDMVDVFLRITAGLFLSDSTLAANVGAAPFSQGGSPPNNMLGDGVDFLDKTQGAPAAGSGCGITLLGAFPYLGTPYDGQEARDTSGNPNDNFKTPRHP